MNKEATGLGDLSTGKALLKMKLAEFANNLRSIQASSLVRPGIILFCSFVVWVLVFSASYGGFHFLKEQKLPLGGGIVGLLFDLLFFSLGALLVLSTGMILYGGLFTSPETFFLLAKPIPPDRIFAYRFAEAIGFSSWAFVILGSPILIAYGIIANSPALFYFYLPFFFVGYVLIPGSLGAICCFLLALFLPKNRKVLFGILGVTIFFLFMVNTGRFFESVRREGVDREFVDATLRQFQFSRWSGLPSHWISRGIRAAGRGEIQKANYNLALVWCNGLALYLLAAGTAIFAYRKAFDRLISFGNTPRKKASRSFVDKFFERALAFLGPERRALWIKDLRAFRREPKQWAQVLVFGFLLFLYFGSVRRSFRGDVTWPFQNGVSFLNLFAVSLLQCTYVGRFVFPMISLEGRNFWILGLMPLSRDSILWSKFHFAFWSTTPIAVALVIFSDIMLRMPMDYFFIHVFTTISLGFAICGLGVGMGGYLPNFRETDPARIAAGFGGTVNLVLSLFALIVLAGLLGGIWHLNHSTQTLMSPGFWGIAISLSSFLVGCILSFLTGMIPMAMGVRHLKEIEF